MSESNPQNILQAAEAFCWAAERAFELGIQHNYGGNISARLGPDRFLTKPTGIGLIDCGVSDLVVTDDQGRPLEGYAAPTKEIQVHLALFRARADVHGIIHYHTPYATAYANAQKPLPLPTLHARRILKKVPVAYRLSRKLSKKSIGGIPMEEVIFRLLTLKIWCGIFMAPDFNLSRTSRQHALS